MKMFNSVGLVITFDKIMIPVYNQDVADDCPKV